MPADIYSFAITMYEVIGWCECYPQTLFKFPWKIVEYVSAGKRQTKPVTMTEEHFELIEKCWNHHPKEQLGIDSIISSLESFMN